MNERKAFAVVLTEDAADDLGDAFSIFIRYKDDDVPYIYAKAIDSEGNYFHLTVDQEISSGDQVEVELQIHHEFIQGAICGEDRNIREFGFA